MRLRNIPGADEVVEASEFVVNNPEAWKGNWKEIFGNEHPIHMEIGMGKGRFIMDLARQNPEINYIGVERYTSVLLRAVQKIEADPLPNIRFLCIDAADLPDYFEHEEVKRIYLNFSDPWPKDRHAKRRLTSKEFLARYKEILAEDGRIEFKTDNRSLFDFSVETLEESDIFKLDEKTYDLHHDSSMNQGNIMTEYEEKFSSQGNPIFKLIASRLLAFILIFATSLSLWKPIKVNADENQYWPDNISVVSPCVMVMEVNTGTVLYEKNADEQHCPASITKILTTLLVLENCELDEVVTFSHDAVYSNKNDGSSIGRLVGEELTIEQCLYAIMLSSANECSYAVAEYVGQKLGGDYQTFIDLMNQRAKELGCTNTNFTNCSGLPDNAHVTTARDYALISAEAYKNETFRVICGTKTYIIPETNKHDEKVYCHNHNNLIYPYKYSKYIYKNCTGGKTGYTDAAKFTLVTYAEKDGMTLVCVVLYGSNPYQMEDSINLYEYFFDNYQVYNIKKNESRFDEDKNKNYGLLNDKEAFLSIDPNSYIILPKTADFTDANFSLKEEKGQPARIEYTYGNRIVGQVDLLETYKGMEFPLSESVKEYEPGVRVWKLNPWYVLLTFVIIAAVGALIYYGIRFVKNFYIIKHKIASRRREKNRFKEVRKKYRRKRRRKRNRMFK